jgi:hypothetical protein
MKLRFAAALRHAYAAPTVVKVRAAGICWNANAITAIDAIAETFRHAGTIRFFHIVFRARPLKVTAKHHLIEYFDILELAISIFVNPTQDKDPSVWTIRAPQLLFQTNE